MINIDKDELLIRKFYFNFPSNNLPSNTLIYENYIGPECWAVIVFQY